MRSLLLAALALGALPATAQTDEPRTVEREVIVERGDDGPTVRRTIIVNGDTTVEVRRGTAAEVFDRDEDVIMEDDEMEVLLDSEVDIEMDDTEGRRDGRSVRLRVESDGNEVVVRQGDGDDANVVRLRVPSIEGLRILTDEGPDAIREMMASSGVSSETRRRMRSLDREARMLAARARSARGADRDALVRELDGVLGELFEVRGDARREEAAHLRERAAQMRAEADEMEAATRERASRRRALIEERRDELLGDHASDW